MTNDETAAQHVRNAMTVLGCAHQLNASDNGGVFISAPDFVLVWERLDRAVRMLENQSQPIGG